jgi:sporulation and spore germination protein
VIKRLIVVGLAIAVLAWLGGRWMRRRAAPPASRVTVVDTLSAAGLRAARLYFAARDGAGLIAEARDLPDRADLHERVTQLVSELDRGPRCAGIAALPPGTSVLHVDLDDRGLMTLDLSRAFRERFEGGTTAEYLALASLVRTLAANVPQVKRVLIVCAGAPLATLGGHLPLDRPLDVSDWP